MDVPRQQRRGRRKGCRRRRRSARPSRERTWVPSGLRRCVRTRAPVEPAGVVEVAMGRTIPPFARGTTELHHRAGEDGGRGLGTRPGDGPSCQSDGERGAEARSRASRTGSPSPILSAGCVACLVSWRRRRPSFRRSRCARRPWQHGRSLARAPGRWGLAVWDDESKWRLDKGIACAHEDARFHELAERRGELLVAHIRQRTVGCSSLDNTHPFQSGRWMFAQQRDDQGRRGFLRAHLLRVARG